MQTSIVLARLIGPVLVVMGLFMLIAAREYRAMADDFLANRALIYLSGLIALVSGLAIVNFHNVWALGWPVIITIFGWLCLIGGLVRIFAPETVKRIGREFRDKPNRTMIGGIVTLVLGAILVVAGYVR